MGNYDESFLLNSTEIDSINGEVNAGACAVGENGCLNFEGYVVVPTHVSAAEYFALCVD